MDASIPWKRLRTWKSMKHINKQTNKVKCKGKGKGKVNARTGHEDPKGE